MEYNEVELSYPRDDSVRNNVCVCGERHRRE